MDWTHSQYKQAPPHCGVHGRDLHRCRPGCVQVHAPLAPDEHPTAHRLVPAVGRPHCSALQGVTATQGSRPPALIDAPEADLVLDLLDHTGADAMRRLTEMHGRTFGPPLLGMTLTGDEMRALRAAAEHTMRLRGPLPKTGLAGTRRRGAVDPDDDGIVDHGG